MIRVAYKDRGGRLRSLGAEQWAVVVARGLRGPARRIDVSVQAASQYRTGASVPSYQVMLAIWQRYAIEPTAWFRAPEAVSSTDGAGQPHVQDRGQTGHPNTEQATMAVDPRISGTPVSPAEQPGEKVRVPREPLASNPYHDIASRVSGNPDGVEPVSPGTNPPSPTAVPK